MLLYISLLNCFLAIHLVVYNWKTNRNIQFLGATLLIISSYISAFHLLITGESRFWLAVLWGNPAPLWYLGGPCLYLYVRGTLNDRFDVRRSDLVHLIPFVVSLVGILPYLFTSFDHKLEVADAIIRDLTVARRLETNWLLSVNANLLLRPMLMIVYALVSIGLILRFESRLAQSRSIPQEQRKTARNWMLMLSTSILAANVIALTISYLYSDDPGMDRDQVNQTVARQISAYVLALIPMTVLLFPQILYGIPRYRQPLSSAEGTDSENWDREMNKVQETAPVQTKTPNYAKGERPQEDPFRELGDRILQAMEHHKPYTDPNFSLDGLAELLDVPKHHLYYCFRNILHTKFTSLRMSYRIEHAKKLLASANLSVVTLESIGKDSGFASKSGFYNTFKAEVGCSPGEYAEKNTRITNDAHP